MYLSKFEKQIALLETLKVPGIRKLPLPVLWKIRQFLKHEKLTRIGEKVVVNSFLPPFPGEAFSKLGESIESLINHKPIPVSAYVSLTSQCRFHCWHCSKAHRNGKDISMETVLGIIKDLQEMGVCIIGFTGGEPLLRDDLEDIIGAVDERSVSILFTTGDGMTEERGRRLKEAGLFGAAISLDHYEPAVHDERRGQKGAFDIAVKAIGIFRGAGVYTMIQLVATKEMANEETFQRYLELACRLGVHEIRLLEPMPTGNLMSCARKCILNDAERAKLKELHILTNSDRKLPKVSAFAHVEHGDLYGCGAGFQHLYIDAQGNVCPCDFTPVSFGNVQKEKVSTIWNRMSAAFGQPGCKCFLLENMDKLDKAFTGELPIEYDRVKNICQFSRRGRLPGYYRALGWEENLCHSGQMAKVEESAGMTKAVSTTVGCEAI